MLDTEDKNKKKFLTDLTKSFVRGVIQQHNNSFIKSTKAVAK